MKRTLLPTWLITYLGNVGRPKRPKAELDALLVEQRQALAASCVGYDAGNSWEAARLATAVYTLIHDGGKSVVSLLTQLGKRGSLRYVSSGRAMEVDGLLASTPPLLMMELVAGQQPRFVPRLNATSESEEQQLKNVQISTWWEKELIFRDHASGSARLTRRALVFALRHQDGGSHIGELSDKSYVRLKAGAGWL